MALRQHQVRLNEELDRRGLQLTFAGHQVCRYTCGQLRDVLRLFDIRFVCHSKLEHCIELLRAKPTLLPREAEAVQLIVNGHGLNTARATLRTSAALPANQTSSNQVLALPSEDNADTTNPYLPGPTRTCSVCLESMAQSKFSPATADAQCTHSTLSTCTECLTNYIAAQAESFPLEAIPCPEERCIASLSYESMKNHAPTEVFERYTERITSQAIHQAADYCDCSNPTCSSGGFFDSQTMTFMNCNECGTATCLSCRTEWHPERSHAENLAALRAAQEARDALSAQQEHRSLQYIRHGSRPCPRCSAPTSKFYGCDHMTW